MTRYVIARDEAEAQDLVSRGVSHLTADKAKDQAPGGNRLGDELYEVQITAKKVEQ